MIIFAMFGAMMFVSKIVMEGLPNIHALALFIVTLTVVYRVRALIPIYLYVILNGLYGGFDLWWMPYLYIWTILWGMAMLLPKKMPDWLAMIVYPLICAIHGIAFGVLYSPGQALMYGFNFEQTLTWIAMGFPFDIIHAAGNFALGFLILPLSKLLLKLEKKYTYQNNKEYTKMDKAPKWIWLDKPAEVDEHAEFFAKFTLSGSEVPVELLISADSDYGVYLNGELIAHGQYADYPHYKVYDRIDISEYVREGENSLAVEVWYGGVDTSTYIKGDAGLWFKVIAGDEILALSDRTVLSRLSLCYRNHEPKIMTWQMGLTYSYDARKEDDWRTVGGDDFLPSAEQEGREAPAYLRPIKRLVTESPEQGELVKHEGNRYLFDFGREIVGIYRIKFHSAAEQNIEIFYGEHIVDGWTRWKIGGREFKFNYYAKTGENDYLGYFRRLGMRYLEVVSEHELEGLEVYMLPRVYPVAEKPFKCEDPEMQKIYDICVYTLKCCMHEHYEDCPWREQALYAMDSRNQMICGYYAFGEYDFPRSCLKLMSEDRREDGLLSICYPAGSNLTIPSFGLHYFTEVREYCDYSGDFEFADEIFGKLESLIGAYEKHRDGRALLTTFEGEDHWNFYEWSEGLSGNLRQASEERADLVFNCLYVIALRNMAYICEKLGREDRYTSIADSLIPEIRRSFFVPEDRAFTMYEGERSYSELGQSLAILSGVAEGDVAKSLCFRLASDNGWTGISLSMKCFKYDALISVDREGFKDYIFSDIKRIYGKMLAEGATTVWETELGESDFNNAGSLCHGWSAMPIYYLHLYK